MRHANVIARELQQRCERESLLATAQEVGLVVVCRAMYGTAEQWRELERRMYARNSDQPDSVDDGGPDGVGP